MAISPAAAALGAAGIKAVGGLAGGFQTNAANAKIAKKQMEFQERMSNTAYQRAADDLEAAGLNRILAIGSPATTPGGAGFASADFGNLIGGAVDTGVAAYSGAQNVIQSQAQTDNILKQTEVLTEKQKQQVEATKLWQTIGPILEKTGKRFGALVDMMSDEELLAAIWDAFKGATTETVTNVTNVMSDWYNVEKEKATEFFYSIDQALTNPKYRDDNLLK